MLLILFDITNPFKCNSFYLALQIVQLIQMTLKIFLLSIMDCGEEYVSLKLGLKSVVLNNIEEDYFGQRKRYSEDPGCMDGAMSR